MSKHIQLLPTIPDKRYFSIGETSKLCAVKPHVLRYWEQEFPQLKPTTRTGGRRYYQYKDVVVARQIRELLYQKGFTIAGAKKQLSVFKAPVEPKPLLSEKKLSPLEELIEELELVLDQISV